MEKKIGKGKKTEEVKKTGEIKMEKDIQSQQGWKKLTKKERVVINKIFTIKIKRHL